MFFSPKIFSIISCFGGVSYGFFLGNFFQVMDYPEQWKFKIDNSTINYRIFLCLFPAGSFIGTILACYLTFKYGRVLATIVTDIITFLAIIFAISSNFELFIIGRLLMGISSGINFPLMLILIKEFVPENNYLKCIIFFQISNTVGIFLSNLFCLANIWQLSLAISIVFPIVRFAYFFMFFLKKIESPLFILNNSEMPEYIRKQRFRQIIEKLYPFLKENLEECFMNQKTLLKENFFMGYMFRKEYVFQLFFCITLIFLNQSCGIDEVLGYSGFLYSETNYYLRKLSPMLFPFFNMLGGISLFFTIPQKKECSPFFPKGHRRFLYGSCILIVILLIFGLFNHLKPAKYVYIENIYVFIILGCIYLLIFQHSLGVYPFIYIPYFLPDVGVFMVLIIRSTFQMVSLITSFYFEHNIFLFCFASSMICLFISNIIYTYYLPAKFKKIIQNDEFECYIEKKELSFYIASDNSQERVRDNNI